MSREETKEVGSGITQHRESRIVFDGPGESGDAEKLFRLLNAAADRNAPWAWLERDREIAERTLAKIAEGETGEDGDRIFEPHHGSGWYSREILKRIGWMEKARDKGDIEWACRSTAELAELLTTIRLKRAWDFDVNTGVAINDALSARRNAANELRQIVAGARHATWQAEASRVWAERPSLSHSATAQIVKARLKEGASVRTIRGAIRKVATPG